MLNWKSSVCLKTYSAMVWIQSTFHLKEKVRQDHEKQHYQHDVWTNWDKFKLKWLNICWSHGIFSANWNPLPMFLWAAHICRRSPWARQNLQPRRGVAGRFGEGLALRQRRKLHADGKVARDLGESRTSTEIAEVRMDPMVVKKSDIMII